MNRTFHSVAAVVAVAACTVAGSAWAKLPAPSDEAKAKALETAAKTAHGNKLANFQLCKSMDKVAASYQANAKKAGKDAKPATTTPACEDPGPFVYAPPGAASAPIATTAKAAPAPAAAPAKK